MGSLVAALCVPLIGAHDLKVPLMGQDHLEECLSKQAGHIAVHLSLNEDRPSQPAPGIVCSLGLVKDIRDVGVLLVLDLDVSLTLQHQLSKISVLR